MGCNCSMTQRSLICTITTRSSHAVRMWTRIGWCMRVRLSGRGAVTIMSIVIWKGERERITLMRKGEWLWWGWIMVGIVLVIAIAINPAHLHIKVAQKVIPIITWIKHWNRQNRTTRNRILDVTLRGWLWSGRRWQGARP